MSLDDSSDTFSAASGRFEIGDADFKLTSSGTATDAGIVGQIHGTGARTVSGIWSTEAENWHGGFAAVRANFGNFSVTNPDVRVVSGEFDIDGARQVTFRDPGSTDIDDVAANTAAGTNTIAMILTMTMTAQVFDSNPDASNCGPIVRCATTSASYGITGVGAAADIRVGEAWLREFQLRTA